MGRHLGEADDGLKHPELFRRDNRIAENSIPHWGSESDRFVQS